MQRVKLTKYNQKKVIAEAITVLKEGGLVIYPTETCYGIGADSTNQEAIDKLLTYKTKRQDKPISVAVTDAKMAAKYVHINKTAKNIYDNFLPGPITVVSKSKHKFARGVESSQGTQGIRIPDHSFVLNLVRAFKKPITATSANASYKKTPYTINDIFSNLSTKQKKMVGLIIDAGRLPKRKPSTIVDTTLDTVHILREGGLDLPYPKLFIAHALEDTEQFVEQLYEKLGTRLGKKTVVFLLQGDLGAGKTYFTKYLAKKLGVKDVVVSPTFTICCEYKGRIGRKPITLQHIDTYRLYAPSEIDALQPKEIFRAPNVVVIEWANKVSEYIEPYLRSAVVIKIRIAAPDEQTRHFEYEIEK
ncbi:MAG: threonylcarbamoyl-AMP synthase [Candidatus Kerfeldbacteria bacterium]|nr:threonylcarbamoyl-AMP synthase [Candidatus Kerfeldbacteria bacterium]